MPLGFRRSWLKIPRWQTRSLEKKLATISSINALRHWTESAPVFSCLLRMPLHLMRSALWTVRWSYREILWISRRSTVRVLNVASRISSIRVSRRTTSGGDRSRLPSFWWIWKQLLIQQAKNERSLTFSIFRLVAVRQKHIWALWPLSLQTEDCVPKIPMNITAMGA